MAAGDLGEVTTRRSTVSLLLLLLLLLAMVLCRRENWLLDAGPKSDGKWEAHGATRRGGEKSLVAREVVE